MLLPRAALLCLTAWSSTALAQWDAGIITLWQRIDQEHPTVDELVIVPVDSAVWQTTAPFILCRRAEGTCVDTWDPSASVLVIDAPVLDDSGDQLAIYQTKLQQVLDLVDDPQMFPELPDVIVTDLGGSPTILTSTDLDAISMYQQVTDMEVWWTGSAVRPETRLP